MRRVASCAVLVAYIGISIATAHADTKPKLERIAGLQVAEWMPDRSSPKPWPIIVFSHGFHGCNTQSTFLMDVLARAGYAVFAPDHHDAACGNVRKWFTRPQAGFGNPAAWNDTTFADRARDVKKLLDALQNDPRFGPGVLDWNKVGLAGHSLGGYTVLGLAGGWPSWKDARVKAVLAMAPYSLPFSTHHTLGTLGVPVMYQGGTRDIGITPFVRMPGGAFEQTSVPKYFVDFDGAGHFAWTDLRATYHREIDEYGVAFFNSYLKHKEFPRDLTHAHDDVSDFRMKN